MDKKDVHIYEYVCAREHSLLNRQCCICAEMEKFVEGGWVSACKYEDELRDMLKERTGGNKEKVRSACRISMHQP